MPIIGPQQYVAEYVPDEDVFKELPDGRVTQLAFKGIPIARGEAMRLGLLKANEPVPQPQPPKKKEKPGPSSNKAGKGPSENK